jgi:hypothetical protein
MHTPHPAAEVFSPDVLTVDEQTDRVVVTYDDSVRLLDGTTGSVLWTATVASAVFAANGQLGTAASFTAGFRLALVVVAGLSLLGTLSALAVSSWRRPQTAARPEAAVAALDTRGLPEAGARRAVVDAPPSGAQWPPRALCSRGQRWTRQRRPGRS